MFLDKPVKVVQNKDNIQKELVAMDKLLVETAHHAGGCKEMQKRFQHMLGKCVLCCLSHCALLLVACLIVAWRLLVSLLLGCCLSHC